MATTADSDSPLLVTYYFYNLLNPGPFLKVVHFLFIWGGIWPHRESVHQVVTPELD